jgi:hypothetical protein
MLQTSAQAVDFKVGRHFGEGQGFFLGSVVHVAFEFHIGNHFLHDSATNSTCFRIPFNVIATFERLGHLSVTTEGKMHPAKQLSGEKRCQRSLQHHEEYRVRALAFGQPPALPSARPY